MIFWHLLQFKNFPRFGLSMRFFWNCNFNTRFYGAIITGVRPLSLFSSAGEQNKRNYPLGDKWHQHLQSAHNFHFRSHCADTGPEWPLTLCILRHRDGCCQTLHRIELQSAPPKLHRSPAFCRQLWHHSDPRNRHRRFPRHRCSRPQLCLQPSYFLQRDERQEGNLYTSQKITQVQWRIQGGRIGRGPPFFRPFFFCLSPRRSIW